MGSKTGICAFCAAEVRIGEGHYRTHPIPADAILPRSCTTRLSTSTFGIERLTLREAGTRRGRSLPLESSFRTVGLAGPRPTSYGGSLRTRIVRVSSTWAGSSRGPKRVRRHSTSPTTRLSSGAEKVRCPPGEGELGLGTRATSTQSEHKGAYSDHPAPFWLLALERLGDFLGAKEIVYSGRVPSAWKDSFR